MADDFLWISEHDVVELVSLADAIDAVAGAFTNEAKGVAQNLAKTMATWGDGHTLHAVGAIDEGAGLVATKTWAHTAGGATPLVEVWEAETGRLLAVIEAFALGQLRTGSVSGLATRWLSRPDASRFAIIGTGKQALAQVAAVANVRSLEEVRVHSRSSENRERFAQTVRGHGFAASVRATDSVAEAVDGADIVTTVTRAREPFLTGDMLAHETHINAVGAISPERRELDQSVLDRCGVVVADSVVAARNLAVELGPVSEIVPLAAVAAGSYARGDDLSVFKAMGVGLADLALAAIVLERARAAGRGRPLPQPTRATPRFKEDL